MRLIGKPTPEFWRTVIITVVVGLATGALGALAVWSRMLDYETSLRITNQPAPLGFARRPASNERELLEALGSTGARSVVSFFEKKDEPGARYLPEEALGRGFVFTSDGWLISHRSGLDPRRRAALSAGIGPFLLPIEKIVEDTETGVLFLKVAQEHLDPLVFAKDGGESGGRVFAVNSSHEVALGWVENPRVRGSSFISSDELGTGLAFTNSLAADFVGGPIFNEEQEVVGIAVEEGGEVGKAVPVAHIQSLFEFVLAGRPFERPTLGVRGFSLADSRRPEGGRERGFLLARDPEVGVRAVAPASPAAAAGLAAGDIIVKLDETVLNGFVDLAEVLLAFRPGEELELTVARNGDELVIPVTLGSRSVGRVYE